VPSQIFFTDKPNDMNTEQMRQMEARLENTIRLLEEQTAQLQQDLYTIRQHITDLESPTEQDADALEKAKTFERNTEAQLKANRDFLRSVDQAQANTTEEDGPMISDLERRATDMLKRMQQKVDANEFLADLYGEDRAENPAQGSPESAKQGEADPPESSATDWKALNDMEKKVDDFKKQDALKDLKDRMKGK